MYYEDKLVDICPRWSTYYKWVQICKEKAMEEFNSAYREYRKNLAYLDEKRVLADVSLLEQYDIIGMTTTSAARMQKTLDVLSPPIGNEN